MVYSNRFVMCVVLNGKPVSELANGTVQLPFGSEYSLRFHNKNDRRAVVKFFIDGENVSGDGYVINAHNSIEIHRHAAFDSSFKFVSLESGDAIAQGKNGPNDDKVKGTIEARFYLEKERTFIPVNYPPYTKLPQPVPHFNGQWAKATWIDQSNPHILRSQNALGTSQNLLGTCFTDDGSRVTPLSSQINHIDHIDHIVHDGCTVEGGKTGQTFGTVNIDLEDDYTVVRIFLQGFEAPIEPVKKRRTNKDQVITDLQEENERLRKELRLRAENKELKEKLGEPIEQDDWR